MKKIGLLVIIYMLVPPLFIPACIIYLIWIKRAVLTSTWFLTLVLAFCIGINVYILCDLPHGFPQDEGAMQVELSNGALENNS